MLLAGSERWISRSYARRLRRYVSEGGRLASFGIESMRRGVTLLHNDERTAGRLVRPTQPAVQDPFGTRFEDVRRTREPVTLTLIGGDAAYPLLLGFDGALGGFSVLEESELPTGERGGELLAALGVETLTEEETQEVPEELPPEPLPALASTRARRGPADPRRPAAVGAAPRRTARSLRSRSTSPTCCAASSRGSAPSRG